MGTKRKVAVWYRRRKKEYVVEPPGWKPMRDGDIVFTDKNAMIEFSHAAKLILKERQIGREYA